MSQEIKYKPTVFQKLLSAGAALCLLTSGLGTAKYAYNSLQDEGSPRAGAESSQPRPEALMPRLGDLAIGASGINKVTIPPAGYNSGMPTPNSQK